MKNIQRLIQMGFEVFPVCAEELADYFCAVFLKEKHILLNQSAKPDAKLVLMMVGV